MNTRYNRSPCRYDVVDDKLLCPAVLKRAIGRVELVVDTSDLIGVDELRDINLLIELSVIVISVCPEGRNETFHPVRLWISLFIGIVGRTARQSAGVVDWVIIQRILRGLAPATRGRMHIVHRLTATGRIPPTGILFFSFF